MTVPAHISDAVFGALARQLNLSGDDIVRRAGDGLDAMGLDSHGLLRVLLEIERRLGLAASLDLPDSALENPTTLAAGVAAVVGAG